MTTEEYTSLALQQQQAIEVNMNTKQKLSQNSSDHGEMVDQQEKINQLKLQSNNLSSPSSQNKLQSDNNSTSANNQSVWGKKSFAELLKHNLSPQDKQKLTGISIPASVTNNNTINKDSTGYNNVGGGGVKNGQKSRNGKSVNKNDKTKNKNDQNKRASNGLSNGSDSTSSPVQNDASYEQLSGDVASTSGNVWAERIKKQQSLSPQVQAQSIPSSVISKDNTNDNDQIEKMNQEAQQLNLNKDSLPVSDDQSPNNEVLNNDQRILSTQSSPERGSSQIPYSKPDRSVSAVGFNNNQNGSGQYPYRSRGGRGRGMPRNYGYRQFSHGAYVSTPTGEQSAIPQSQAPGAYPPFAMGYGYPYANPQAYYAYMQTAMEKDAVKLFVMRQVEYYFSIDNLVHDLYFRSFMDDDGYVPISVIAAFPRIKAVTTDIEVILEGLKLSPALQVNEDKVRVTEGHDQWILPKDQRRSAYGSQTQKQLKESEKVNQDDTEPAEKNTNEQH